MTEASAAPVGVGVVGATSSIATQAVLPALAACPLTRVVSVASRDARAAADVAAKFGAARSAGEYGAVLDDPEVEAVYVPLPNSLHREWTERAAAAGRHVLCEKPLAPSADDARAMARACEAAGVVLMEAYMTPFHPRAPLVGDLVRRGCSAGCGSPGPSSASRWPTLPTTGGCRRWEEERCSTSGSTACRRWWRSAGSRWR